MPVNYNYSVLENGTLAIATIVFGIMAGFFWTYSFNVNLAMLEVGGETYAVVQSLFNENVRHLMFFAFFFGGGFFSVVALIANYKKWKSVSFLLIAIAALVYIVGVIAFTQQVNLPLNYYTESWDPSQLPADWSDIRNRWNDANMIRVGTSFLPFALCVLALVLRASRSSSSNK